MDRRTLLTTLLAAPLVARSSSADAAESLGRLEARAGGRLGVCALDLTRGRTLVHRADERFALCSTFKLPLAALVLRAADAGTLDLATRLNYGEADLVPHAPVTGPRIGEGAMAIGELAEATQTTSDNVAANLLVRHFGGPAAVTALLRVLGDQQTRLDRWEPELNRVPPGEERDTTTPAAMSALVARLWDGQTLTPKSAATLQQWLVATKTGAKRLRAGFPAGWLAGDKTGTALIPGLANKHNDVAVVWRAGKAVLVVAAYFEADGYYDRMRPEDDAVLAEVGRIVTAWCEPTLG